MKIARLTGQSENYKKFVADQETPSGVESVEADDVRNSTQRAGSSLNLVLTDVSSIRVEGAAEDDIEFEELAPVDENNLF